RLVGHSFQIRGELHCGNNPAQIGRHRLKTQQQIDSVLVDLLLELIDLFVIRDGDRAKIVVALEQSSDRAVEAALRQARHEQNVVAQGGERFVESGENVIRFW